MSLTFGLTVLAWIFFRADNIGHAISYLKGMISITILAEPSYTGVSFLRILIPLIIFFVLTEWTGRKNMYAIEKLPYFKYTITRYSLYYSILFLIFWFASELKDQQFIYFQF